MGILTKEGGYLMTMLRTITLIVVCILYTSLLKAEDKPLPESQEKLGMDDPGKNILEYFDIYDYEHSYKKRRYRAFREIKEFSKQATNVWLIGKDAKKIGLDEKELTDYLKLKIRNNFGNIKFKKDSIKAPPYPLNQIGVISLRVWVAGNNYPVAYHLRYKFYYFGSHDSPIWETERLWYGSKDSVPYLIKEDIDSTIEDLAIFFFKARGEL